MIGPDENDFYDRIAAWFSTWRPELMNRVSLADMRTVWERVEDIMDEAGKREPIQPVSRQPSSSQQPRE
jgi:hypothetical protein